MRLRPPALDRPRMVVTSSGPTDLRRAGPRRGSAGFGGPL